MHSNPITAIFLHTVSMLGVMYPLVVYQLTGMTLLPGSSTCVMLCVTDQAKHILRLCN